MQSMPIRKCSLYQILSFRWRAIESVPVCAVLAARSRELYDFWRWQRSWYRNFHKMALIASGGILQPSVQVRVQSVTNTLREPWLLLDVQGLLDRFTGVFRSESFLFVYSAFQTIFLSINHCPGFVHFTHKFLLVSYSMPYLLKKKLFLLPLPWTCIRIWVLPNYPCTP